MPSNEVLTKILREIYDNEISLDRNARSAEFPSIVNNFVHGTFIQKMREVDHLFDELYVETYFGGSYYDGLRVAVATEYDLNLVLDVARKASNVTFQEEKGFMRIRGQRRKRRAKTSSEVQSLFTNKGNLFPAYVLEWFMGVCTRACMSVNPHISEHGIDDVSIRRSGPAVTLEVRVSGRGQFDVDLVPVITHNYRNEDVVCVPKSLKGRANIAHLWRFSNPGIEQEMLFGAGCAKMVIKLLKRMRDVQGSTWARLPSYHLKKMVLELGGYNLKNWKERELGHYFMVALKRLPVKLDHNTILIHQIRTKAVKNICDRVQKIIADVERDPENIKKYFKYVICGHYVNLVSLRS